MRKGGFLAHRSQSRSEDETEIRGNMRDLLLADLSVMDIHFQLWMVLVTAILLIWFAFVWATRHVR
jgi:hypothetical protein